MRTRAHGGRMVRAGLARTLRRIGESRVRLVVVAAAVVVAAGAAGGYLGLTSTGTAASPDGGRPGALHGAGVASPSPAGASAPGVGGATADSGSAGSGAIACPMIGGGTDATGVDGNLSSATHVFTRTTADGVTIRAYVLSPTASCTCGPITDPTTNPTPSVTSPGFTGSAPVPTPLGSVSLEFSDTTAVGEGVLFDAPGPSATTPNAAAEPVAGISGTFGVPEGAPVWWVAVSVGPEVTGTQMTFADGSTDQMAPVNGVAVLAHQIDPSVVSSGDGPYDVRGTLRLLDSSGAVIRTVTFPEATPPPTPILAPLPVAVPGSYPASAPGSTPSTSVLMTSPPASTGSATACPDVVAPTTTSAR